MATRGLSRRSFLVSGAGLTGGMFVALTLSPAVLASQSTGIATAASHDAFKPNAYLEIDRQGAVTCYVGKAEMGQGALTGIAQLIAEELGCSWQQLKVVRADAAPAFGFPHNGFNITGGSSTIRSEWMRMRRMGAAARTLLVRAAAERWKLAPDSLVVEQGEVIANDGRRLGFAELVGAAAALPLLADDEPQLRNSRTVIGHSIPRLDTREKTTGEAIYGVDVQFDGLRTAIVLPAPRFNATIAALDADKARAMPGVEAVFPVSGGVAIVGRHYWAVHAARGALSVEWQGGELLGGGSDAIRAGYREALNQTGKIAATRGRSDQTPIANSVALEFEQPYLAHACMEPMNITVRIDGDSAEVWGPTQAQTFTQKTVAEVAGIAPDKVTVHTTFLGGGFGRRSAQDFVRLAAEIASKTKWPIKLMYSREDDMRAGRYRPFNLTRVSATLDPNGAIDSLHAKVATPAVSRWSGLMFLIGKDGVDKQAVEGLTSLPYEIPNLRVEWVEHDPKVPVHFWRAVGASHNPFAVETVIDELAMQAKVDPLVFRVKHLHHQPRHLAVLEQLASASMWGAAKQPGTGRGMALVESFGSIVAQAVKVRISAARLQVEEVTCVVDCGIAINPSQIEAQMHSSIVYGMSAFLRGEITFTDGAVDQSNFHDFEPLRFFEMPKIKVVIIEGGQKPGGIGEPGLPPILPALANAVFDITGERVLKLPYRLKQKNG